MQNSQSWETNLARLQEAGILTGVCEITILDTYWSFDPAIPPLGSDPEDTPPTKQNIHEALFVTIKYWRRESPCGAVG